MRIRTSDPQQQFVMAGRLLRQVEIGADDVARLAACPSVRMRTVGTVFAVVEVALRNVGPEVTSAPQVTTRFEIRQSIGGSAWWIPTDRGDRAGVMAVAAPMDARVKCADAVMHPKDVRAAHGSGGAVSGNAWLGRTGMSPGETHRATILMVVPPDSGVHQIGYGVSTMTDFGRAHVPLGPIPHPAPFPPS